MTSSKWHALGNVYLLVEQADRLTADDARELAQDTDGVLEIRGDQVTVWNPDGSVAEMSGNGARIAAAWYARETGSPQVRFRIGERDVSATSMATTSRSTPGASRSVSRRHWTTSSSSRCPSATRMRSCDTTRPTFAGSARESRRIHAFRSARTSSSSESTERTTSPSQSGSAEQGDDGVGVERDRGGRGGDRERLVREPGDGAHAGRRPLCRARRRRSAANREIAGGCQSARVARRSG